MKRFMFLAVLLPVASALSANWPKVGPNYRPPKATVPDSYHQQTGASGTNVDAAISVKSRFARHSRHCRYSHPDGGRAVEGMPCVARTADSG